MSDVGPYGTLGNADADAVTADQLVGEHAGNVTAHQTGGRFSPARSSTAPYQPPAPSATTTATVPAPSKPEICGYRNCRQPVSYSGYCERHQP